MTKRKYLRRLRKALGNIPASEKEDIISYYDELIEESFDRGKTAKEVFSELDPPEVAAENYLREKTGGAAPVKKRSTEDAIWLPFRILLGFILSILWIAVFSVFLALFLSGIVCGIVGVYIFIMSFGPLFSGHPAIAFAQFGTAIAVTGASGLLIAVAPLLWKANAALWRLVVPSEKPVKPVRKGKLVTIAVSAAIILLGVIVFYAGLGGLGFRYENLAVTDGIETREQIVTEHVDNLVLEGDNLALKVQHSEKNEIRLVYREVDEVRKNYSYENGTITLRENEDWRFAFTVFGTSAKLAWTRGIFFSAVAQEIHRAELYLPTSFSGNLSVKTANGTISIADMVCSDLVLETDNGVISLKDVTANNLHAKTDNGVVSLENVTAEGRIEAHSDNGTLGFKGVVANGIDATTSNGLIRLEDVTAQKVKAETNNGAIKLDRLDAEDIDLETDNGAITGSVVGSMTDYSIDSRTSNGSNNLPNRTEGERRLRAKTYNGAIRISFTK